MKKAWADWLHHFHISLSNLGLTLSEEEFAGECERFFGRIEPSLVLKLLIDEEMLSPDLVSKMRNWKHSGFSVYCTEPNEACDNNSQNTLSKCISRDPFSLERMSFNEGKIRTLCFTMGSILIQPLAWNFEVAGTLEWKARTTSHIPRK